MPKAETIYKDFKSAREYRKAWLKEAEEDYEYLLGKQWSDEDVAKLKKAGVDALTINKIQPFVFLCAGIQRQNRTDFMAFPIGDEDSLTANIATRLLKSITRNTMLEFKASEQYEDGLTCGEGYIEPYMDYTYDLLVGQMKMAKLSPLEVFPEPGYQEYDMSDCGYIIILKTGISKEKLIQLFPEQKKKIEKIENGKLDLDLSPEEYKEELGDAYRTEAGQIPSEEDEKEKGYDLVRYFYKKYITKYIVVDKILGDTKEAKDKEEAEKYQAMMQTEDPENPESVVILDRLIPEIWIAYMVGNHTVLKDEKSWTYPKWRDYPVSVFFAHRTTVKIKKKELMVQGIVRSMKGVQRQHNKFSTQELRHLNQSVNSGIVAPKGVLSPATIKKLKKLGSSPGFFAEYDINKAMGTTIEQWKVKPTPLSQGHAQLKAERSQEFKDISGINTDALAAQDSKTVSGRAIALRQQQGLVMIQRILDNFEQTKKIQGRFLLSQMGEIYTVETAIKTLGEAFIQEHFAEPLEAIAQRVQMKIEEEGEEAELSEQQEAIYMQVQEWKATNPDKPMMDEAGEPMTMVDQAQVGQIINNILNDSGLGKYDVAVGEGANTETVKIANYNLLMDMAERGMMIPPEVMIEESFLSESSKMKIKEAFRKAQEAQVQAARGGV